MTTVLLILALIVLVPITVGATFWFLRLLVVTAASLVGIVVAGRGERGGFAIAALIGIGCVILALIVAGLGVWGILSVLAGLGIIL